MELRRRQFGRAVRLEISAGITEEVRELLQRELGLGDDDTYRLAGPLDLGGLWSVHALDRPDLKDPVYQRISQARLEKVEDERPDVFAVLRDGDVLVHHPYDSFRTSVEEFIRQASVDPHVLAIKMTLYRTSGDSPIVRSLIRAAERGKQVAVLVELKARFDESANIEWAKALETAGVHVVYGLVGLKVHTKTALVVRDEPEGIRRYCHIGTGNYNSKTARVYEDLGLLTSDPEVGADLTQLFNFLTGYGRDVQYRRLLVAPYAIRPGLEALIDDEVAAARAGKPAAITLKLNSISDPDMIDRLYAASQAGVDVQLIVRGLCCLVPGVPGQSDRITRALDRRPLPRALADLPVRQRRGRGARPLPDRLGRPHAPQPRPPGGVPGGGGGPRPPAAPRRGPRGEPGRRHPGLGAGPRRHLGSRAAGRDGGRPRAPPGARRRAGPPARLTSPNVGWRFTWRSPEPRWRATRAPYGAR